MEPTDQDLLLDLEKRQVPPHYKPYYINKRQNLFATIQEFPYLWNCFMHLDEIVLREFDMMERATNVSHLFPMILFMNSHQKVRTAFELGCATCLAEAHSIMRDAIESAAHGHRISTDPALLKPWIEKNDSEAAKKVFRQEFEDFKAKRLFDGLPELYKLWGGYSELGSHTNVNSIVSRFVITETPSEIKYRLNYLGGEPRIFVPALFAFVLVFNEIEKLVFKLAAGRLRLDTTLLGMRDRFKMEMESTRQHIIKVFNIQRPTSKSAIAP